MDAPLQTPQPLRYEGTDRRLSRGEYLGPERRVCEPATEQDHPELYEGEPAEAQ